MKSAFRHGLGLVAWLIALAGLSPGGRAAEIPALKLDFSEKTGIRFQFYSIDTFLHISFKDGRISERKTGPNGVHSVLTEP